MSDVKAREFWLVCDNDKDMSATGFIYVRESGHPKEIHVISYEAYDQLLKERDELKARVARLESALKSAQRAMNKALAITYISGETEVGDAHSHLNVALDVADGALKQAKEIIGGENE